MSYSKFGINESIELGFDNIQVSYCFFKRVLFKVEYYGIYKQVLLYLIVFLKFVGNDLYLMLVFFWLLKSIGIQIKDYLSFIFYLRYNGMQENLRFLYSFFQGSKQKYIF